ncbi:hypothetical protein [Nitratireductor sp. XY-223]|uniref:hypothetical protein n=1 Tax=Nitratireductor sp. XY-223 TaxID=2561926 RepID=UPI0010AB34A1|nr:hypothetical protein [Nitratireductor sp. XY-223]
MDDDHTYEEMKKPAKAHIFTVGPSIPARTDSLANLLSGSLLSLIPKLLICAVLCMFLGAAVFAAPFGRGMSRSLLKKN